MRRLLVVGLTVSLLASCSLVQPSAPFYPSDPGGATLTASQGPNYTTLTYLPGKTATLNTVAHLVGPALRVRDERCSVDGDGLLCQLGTVPVNERRVIYVSGFSRGTLTFMRADGNSGTVSTR